MPQSRNPEKIIFSQCLNRNGFVGFEKKVEPQLQGAFALYSQATVNRERSLAY